MRGVKAAVAMEMLKAAYLDSLDSPLHEFCMAPDEFKGPLVRDLNHAIRETLKRRGVQKQLREDIADSAKLQGLNRRSFAKILMELCRFIGLEVRSEDIKLLVRCRNSLVHRVTCPHSLYQTL
jgi:hypothetical protein